MASPTRWTRVWGSSGSWRRTGKPSVLQSMGWQRVGHDWATELNWTLLYNISSSNCSNPSFHCPWPTVTKTPVHRPNAQRGQTPPNHQFGAEKGLLQGHARRWVTHALKNPKLPKNSQQSPFLERALEREGRVSCCKRLGGRACVPEVRSYTVKEWCSCKPPPTECYPLFWQERTQSPGTTITSEVQSWLRGADLSWQLPQGQVPRSSPAVITEGARAQDPTSPQALQATHTTEGGRAGPTDGDPYREVAEVGMGERVITTSRPRHT